MTHPPKKPTRPAPPLVPQQAARRDRLPSPSSGLGLTSLRAREHMVQRLQQQGIRHPAVLDAMRKVPRHAFVDEALASRAYEDDALPIGHQQTISRPFIVARMAELLMVALPSGRPLRVLEIGTGCGYQAAVLAQLFAEVYSIERIAALHERAKHHLRAARLGDTVSRVRLVHGDGLLGLPELAPFEAITVAAAGLDLPSTLLNQLAFKLEPPVHGRLVVPVSQGEGQVLSVVDRVGTDSWRREDLDPVRFVPLLSGTQG